MIELQLLKMKILMSGTHRVSEAIWEQHSLSFQISVFHDGLDIVTDYKADYDIILMDIQMKHLDGMTTVKNPKAG